MADVAPRFSLSWLWVIALWLSLSTPAAAESFSLVDAADNELHVEMMPAEGDLLVIWLLDHDERRAAFDTMLDAINAAGMEVWRVDLLADYFLPRSNEHIRMLDGEGVAALLQAAHARSGKQIVLASYERMSLPLLRGARRWQERHQGRSQLAGAVLYYPNLFGPAPLAGEDPQLDPIVLATNIPVTVYQPENGPHRWRLQEVMQGLWSGGSPAFAYWLADSRDWFFMHEAEQAGAPELAATRQVPALLAALGKLMAGLPKPEQAAPLPATTSVSVPVRELVAFTPEKPASDFTLNGVFQGEKSFSDYQGKVTLINFWATWCPPCVEEIPSLNRLVDDYAGQDFAVVSIDYRESEQQIREFTERVPVRFAVLLDRDGLVALAWKVFSFPSSFIVDRRGRIRYSVNRAIDWQEPTVRAAIDRLLAENGGAAPEG
jgi:thiol-disulfide isomerase/thioredoxin